MGYLRLLGRALNLPFIVLGLALMYLFIHLLVYICICFIVQAIPPFP